MQSCSKRNELPLNDKLCVRFLFLIYAEYSKVSSFFFCTDSDLRRFWLAPILTCVEFDLRGVWLVPSLTCAEFDFRRVWLPPSLTCAEFDLRQVWLAPSLTCAEFDLHRVWLAPSLTCTEFDLHRVCCTEMYCADFVAPKCRKSLKHHTSVTCMTVNLKNVLLIAISLLKQLTMLLEILEWTEPSSACYCLMPQNIWVLLV